MREGKPFDHLIKYKADIELVTPMHVGASFSERNEVLLHPVDGLPFVQASSITGSFRNYYSKEKGSHLAEDLFGSAETENASRLIVSDGIFRQDTVKFEMRPRVKIDPVSGTTAKSKAKGTDIMSGHKFDMECVAAGSRFSFVVYAGGYDFSDEKDLIAVFSALGNGSIAIGGQKSNGFGKVKILKLLSKKFDLTSDNDFKAWIREETLEDDEYDDITLSLSGKNDFAYRIRAKAKTESGILVKGYQKTGFGETGAYATNIRDAGGNCIVPGSSLKGALRSRIENILAYKETDDATKKKIIRNIFGEAESGGCIGNVVSYDSTIATPEGTGTDMVHRIHIDKISGSVMSTGLFSEERTFGEIDLQLDIMERNDPELTCGYMIMAFRDLALNLFNLGGGYNIGNGMVSIERIFVESKDGEAVLDIDSGEITDEQDIIGRCIKATGEV